MDRSSAAPTRAPGRASHELFEVVRSRKTLDDVLHQIADAIRSGKVGEGELLPGERALADQMQVSRPTVRAAVQELVDAGVLEVTSGRGGGARVLSMWVPPELTASSRRQPSSDAVFRLLEARRTVEPRLAQLAAVRASERHFARMQRSIELLDAHRDERGRYEQAHDLFHRVMWQAAQNPVLERAMVSIFRELAVERDSMMRIAGDHEVALELHDSTLRALKSGRPERVEREMHRHLEHFELLMEDVFERGMTNRIPEFLRDPAGS
jgi:GntR family transcriptional regulator, transcriptional repressor for pyruvate dehydrogenase complex